MAEAQLTAVGYELDGARLELHTGDPRPVTAAEAIAVLTFGTPAFASASHGEALARPVLPDTGALRTGTPTWARLVHRDGGLLRQLRVGPGQEVAVVPATIRRGTRVLAADVRLTI